MMENSFLPINSATPQRLILMHKAAPWPTGLCAPVRVPPALLLGGAGGAARQEEDVRPSMVQRDKGVLVPDPPPNPSSFI